MNHFGRAILLAALLVPVLPCPSQSAIKFEFKPLQLWASVPASQDLLELRILIRSTDPHGDQLRVEFDTHMPNAWFSQYCQTSTGICYFDDATLDLPNANPDTLRVDFFMLPGQVAKGWIDMRVYRLNDAADFDRTTLAVGHGVTLPVPSYTFRCANVFRRVNPQDDVEFFSPLRSLNTYLDSVIVSIRRNHPAAWFTQFCQTSTGICYFDRATIEFPALARDTLRVDFFCDDPNPAIGRVEILTQSAANPAIWRWLPYRVETGIFPTGVEEADEPLLALTVAPNPLREHAEFELRLAEAATASLEIFDLAGRLCHSRTLEGLPPGTHRIRWDGRDGNGVALPSGVYFYRARAAGHELDGKLLLSR